MLMLSFLISCKTRQDKHKKCDQFFIELKTADIMCQLHASLGDVILCSMFKF